MRTNYALSHLDKAQEGCDCASIRAYVGQYASEFGADSNIVDFEFPVFEYPQWGSAKNMKNIKCRKTPRKNGLACDCTGTEDLI